ncbi:hypothetical protein CDD83_6866 [Cordyceps sp. RAO-2017]|nr:hypothetical protein CDD83_6866 [Cordyceps sp. RAO-2017]
MASSMTALDAALKNLSRNSVDSAISTTSSDRTSSQYDQATSPEIAGLFKAAGGPEALVQHLLRERQSLYQQNAQLWKVVNDQRAMVARLNRNAELAVQEKEKYRKGFDNLLTNLALFKSPEAHDGSNLLAGLEPPSMDVLTSMTQPGSGPPDLVSALLGHGGQNSSAADGPMAAHLLAQSIDRQNSPTATEALPEPSQYSPKPQELARGGLDQAPDTGEKMRPRSDESSENVRIPTSRPPAPSRTPRSHPENMPRSHPENMPRSHPENMPPVKPPSRGPPPHSGFEFSLPDRGLPNAHPISRPGSRTDQAPFEDVETDSVSDVQEIIDQSRMQHRVRAENFQEQQRSSVESGIERSLSSKSDLGTLRTLSGGPERLGRTAEEGAGSQIGGPSISGLAKLQLLQDSAALAARADALGRAGDKKQKKRGLFGIGSKTRDSQDSSTAGSDAGSVAPTTQPGGNRVFGAPLEEAAQYYPPARVDVALPAVAYRCLQYLDSHGAVREEGIFRISGSSSAIKELRERFNARGDVDLVGAGGITGQPLDIHAIASLLKLYLRELPEQILTKNLQWQFIRLADAPDSSEKLAALTQLARRLPRANAALLKHLFSLLIKIISKADVNKMSVRNIGIVFLPTLNMAAPVFSMLLQHYEIMFGIAPEACELPSLSYPEAEAETEPPSVATARSSVSSRTDSLSSRPSTSSSHRLRRTESRDTIRSDKSVRLAPMAAKQGQNARYGLGHMTNTGRG